MSEAYSDTVNKFSENYDTYIGKITEKIKRTEQERDKIKENVKDIKEHVIFSPVEAMNRKTKKEGLLRKLQREKDTAEGIQQKLSRPGKEVAKEIEALEFYTSGEWKD